MPFRIWGPFFSFKSPITFVELDMLNGQLEIALVYSFCVTARRELIRSTTTSISSSSGIFGDENGKQDKQPAVKFRVLGLYSI